jgi:8-oxo-dGTP pyrophosphatase MutT (NUDIX family)
MTSEGEPVFQARACGLVFHQSKLLIQRKLNDAFWALPGGRIEPHEISSEAVVREFQEELGLLCTVERLVWVIENRFSHKGRLIYEVGFCFLLAPDQKQLAELDMAAAGAADLLEFRWIGESELGTIQFKPEALRASLFSPPDRLVHLVS